MVTGSLAIGAVVLNWNGWEDTAACVQSLRKATYPSLEVLIVDNGSTDGSADRLRERFPGHPIIATGENLGYAGGNNVGIRYWLDRRMNYILILNNDTLVDPSFLEPMVSAMQDDSSLGLIGPLILYQSDPNTVQCVGLDVNISLGTVRSFGDGEQNRGQYQGLRRVQFLGGTCLLVRSEVFEKVGLLDETFFMYAEEVEFLVRASRAGYHAAVAGSSKICHKSKASTNKVHGLFLYYITRNRVLLGRRIASWTQWLIFVVFDLCVRFPRWMVLLRGEPGMRRLYIQAMRDGYAGRGGRMEFPT